MSNPAPKLPGPILPEKPIENETFLHRQSGGLTDELVKRQLRDREEADRMRTIDKTTVASVIDEAQKSEPDHKH